MGLFNSLQPKASSPSNQPTQQIPISQVDLSKRYDVYWTGTDHDRLYENIRFIGIRTFDRISEYSSGLVCGYLEIEAANGSRMLIPTFGIQLICEHGTEAVYKVVRRRGNAREY